jgi:Na+/H+ antiporter NhaA
MPTDTAFALGVLALAGSRMPARLRVFVLTVVIADDIGTLLVIAVAYTDAVSVVALLVSLGLLVAALAARRLGIAGRAPYLLLGLGMWVAMAKSGVHPTLAGVLIGLTVSGTPPARQELERASAINRLFREQPTPELARSARQSVENAVSSNERLQYGLHPWTSFLIVPLFALANAGIEINGALIDRAVSSPVTLGVVAGLVVGKLVGISAASALAAHPRLGRLPLPVELPPIIGASAVAGIGFTLSLFIADIALSGDALSEAKIGILAAAVISAALGTAIFRVIERMQARPAGRVRVRPSKPIIDLARPVDPSRDHVRGPRDAPVTLLEYGDYECGYCGRAEGMIRSLLSDFGDDLRYAWRHLPLQDGRCTSCCWTTRAHSR